jgi:GntR family histidine utilization transcriptional repressor
MAESPYQIIKRHISDGVVQGLWRTGALLPSEHELCRSFGVSRMTVNRAMRELAAEHLVRRVPGLGTFVAEPVAESSLVEIHSIAAEVTGRGHRHRAEVQTLQRTTLADAAEMGFDIPAGGSLFHSAVVHFENDLPIQYEDKLVDPASAPDYLHQDFSLITPNEYLSRIAPLREVEHVVQAVHAPAEIAVKLAMPKDAPCLLVVRRTWSHDRLVTLSHLYHPGSSFRLAGRFRPAHVRDTSLAEPVMVPDSVRPERVRAESVRAESVRR